MSGESKRVIGQRVVSNVASSSSIGRFKAGARFVTLARSELLLPSFSLVKINRSRIRGSGIGSRRKSIITTIPILFFPEFRKGRARNLTFSTARKFRDFSKIGTRNILIDFDARATIKIRSNEFTRKSLLVEFR